MFIMRNILLSSSYLQVGLNKQLYSSTVLTVDRQWTNSRQTIGQQLHVSRPTVLVKIVSWQSADCWWPVDEVSVSCGKL